MARRSSTTEASSTTTRHGLEFSLSPTTTPGRQKFQVRRIVDGVTLASQPIDAPVGDAATLARHTSAWISEQLGANAPPPALCVGCQTVLEPVSGTNTDYQYENALWLKANGGYAMFVDDIDGDRSIVLCHGCAHELCDSSDVMRRLLQPWSSHGHDFTEIEDLIVAGHRGWDLDEFRLDDGPELASHVRTAHPEIGATTGLSLWLEHHRAHRSGRFQHTHIAANPDPPPLEP